MTKNKRTGTLDGDILTNYQKTFIQTRGEGNEFCWALGLAGEAGEVADLVKKFHFHGGHDKKGEITPARILDECGDVIWYLAALLDYHKFTLADAMIANCEKLCKRHPSGFTAESAAAQTDYLDRPNHPEDWERCEHGLGLKGACLQCKKKDSR